MCGIAGLALARSTQGNDKARTTAMIKSIRHRGPDEQSVTAVGQCVLACARLAIVDVQGGRQPFSSEDGSVMAVVNGEITNYVGLRSTLMARGHEFSTHTDGEVVVHLYEEHGPDFCKVLDGQFAIALHDIKVGRTVLARDRFGICPLHWTLVGDVLAFASETKAIFASDLTAPAVDPIGLAQVAYFGTAVAPRTVFDGVAALPPGHFLVWETGSEPVLTRYWRLPVGICRRGRGIAREAATVGRLFRTAVKRCAMGEIRPVAFLSGGVDSGFVAGSLRHAVGEPVHALTVGPDHGWKNETTSASALGAALGIHVDVCHLNARQVASHFLSMMWHLETPVLSTESAGLYALAQRARRHSKVVLTGEGADEAFAGYRAFRQARYLAPLWRQPMAWLRSPVRAMLRWWYGSDCLVPSESARSHLIRAFGLVPAQAVEWEFYRETLRPLLNKRYRALLDDNLQLAVLEPPPADGERESALQGSLRAGYDVMLANYLLGPHSDRVLAAASVEGRYPFLDRELVEYATSLPASMKLSRGQDKTVLRVAAQEIVPTTTAWRKKVRFTMPFASPFIGPEAPPLYARLLSRDTVERYGYLDADAVAAVLDQAGRDMPKRCRSGKRYLRALALGLSVSFMATLQLWHYVHVEGHHDLDPSDQDSEEKGESTCVRDS